MSKISHLLVIIFATFHEKVQSRHIRVK